MVEQCAGDDPDVEINLGCLLYKVEILGPFIAAKIICAQLVCTNGDVLI